MNIAVHVEMVLGVFERGELAERHSGQFQVKVKVGFRIMSEGEIRGA